MLFLGFSAGVPLLLIFSSLGLWLREAGIDRSTATLFSWAALGYSFKFVWAPIIDQFPLPYLTRKLGRRRAWILTAQLAVIAAIILMSLTDPSAGTAQLKLMALAAVMLGFSSATQDIVIDAYRIESASSELQAMMASTYIAGYRIGMLVAGAGSLYIASILGTSMGAYNYTAWQLTYSSMALIMFIGIATTLIIKEPEHNQTLKRKYTNPDYVKFLAVFLLAVSGFILSFQLSSEPAAGWKDHLSELLKNPVLANFCVEILRFTFGLFTALCAVLLSIKLKLVEWPMVAEIYIEPIADFFRHYGLKPALLLLTLIGLYRISDIVLGVIANIFYQDSGYSKKEIASIVKTFGVAMTIIGGLLGGLLVVRFNIIKILFLGAILTIATNLLFMLLAIRGYDIPLLYAVISADNFSAGLASAAFIAFLSRLTNISFTAMQYAIFSSIMTLLPKIIGGYSGAMVENIGYLQFFLFASLLGIPVLAIIYLANKHLQFRQTGIS